MNLTDAATTVVTRNGHPSPVTLGALRGFLHAAVVPPVVVPPTGLPAYRHIVVCVLENHAASEILGNTGEAPFINTVVAGGGAVLTDYHALSHPSEPNYFALYAGSTFGVGDDGDYSESDPSLATALSAVGKSFAGFIETASPRKHNPWESFPESAAVERDFAQWPASYASLPDVAFVIPDLSNDMHDGSISQGDAWVRDQLGSYLTWCKANNSLFFLVFDEDDTGGDTPVVAILYGAHIVPGPNATTLNHFSALRTICAIMGAAAPRRAATATLFPTALFSA